MAEYSDSGLLRPPSYAHSPTPAFVSSTLAVLSLAEPLSSSTFLTGIRDAAREHSIWISVGIHELPESAAASKASSSGEDGTRCYNTQCLINPDGDIASVYRKLHLFDVDSEQMKIKESGTTLKGDKLPEITSTAIGKGACSLALCEQDWLALIRLPWLGSTQSACSHATICVSPSRPC